jgi:predicted ester cyclase
MARELGTSRSASISGDCQQPKKESRSASSTADRPQSEKGAAVTDNERLIRELYDAAEGKRLDTEMSISMFASDGYMRDVPSGADLRGQAIGESIAGLARAFPDVHREIFSVHVSGDVLVVELATRGTHEGELKLGSTFVPPMGKSIDVPSCDVFHLRSGKIASFHCYSAASVMMRQLGVSQE